MCYTNVLFITTYPKIIFVTIGSSLQRCKVDDHERWKIDDYDYELTLYCSNTLHSGHMFCWLVDALGREEEDVLTSNLAGIFFHVDFQLTIDWYIITEPLLIQT